MQSLEEQAEFTDLVVNDRMVFGISATSIKHRAKELQIPNQLSDEIPTLNRMGYMKIDLDTFCEEFIEYATSNKGIVLELGCAYGFIVQQVLAKGGKIIANDLSKDHLLIVLKNTPQEYLNNLYLYPGAFPGDINLPLESINAILTSRMMHFLQGKEIKDGLDKIHNWLVPGGKLYFVATSPYNNTFKDKFLHKYLDGVKAGNDWPGVINNLHEIAPQHKEYVGSYINLFAVPQLEELLPKHGFQIEKISLFDYPNRIDSEGKGHIGFVASKV